MYDTGEKENFSKSKEKPSILNNKLENFILKKAMMALVRLQEINGLTTPPTVPRFGYS